MLMSLDSQDMIIIERKFGILIHLGDLGGKGRASAYDAFS